MIISRHTQSLFLMLLAVNTGVHIRASEPSNVAYVILNQEQLRNKYIQENACLKNVHHATPRSRDKYNFPLEWSSTQYPNSILLRKEDMDERFGTGFTVAITEELGITGKAPQLLPSSDSMDLLTECHFIEKYYTQTRNPTVGCLVAYTDADYLVQQCGRITQVPDVTNPLLCRVKSKWGTEPYIVEHDLFNITPAFGNFAYFFELKDTYKDNKASMLNSIQSDIAKSEYIKHMLEMTKKAFFCFASGSALSFSEQTQKDTDAQNTPAQKAYNSLKECIGLKTNTSNGNDQLVATLEDQTGSKLIATLFFIHEASVYSKKTPTQKAYHLFKTCMGLDANITNDENQTPLMLAAQRGDKLMSTLFFIMGVKIDHQDNDGNTALHLAAENKHDAVITMLLESEADVTIQNKKGEYAAIDNDIIENALNNKHILFILAHGNKIAFEQEDLMHLNDKSSVKQAQYVLKNTNVNINFQDSEFNSTALMVAVSQGNIAMAKLLLAYGADTRLKNIKGDTAYAMAKINYEDSKNKNYLKEQAVYEGLMSLLLLEDDQKIGNECIIL